MSGFIQRFSDFVTERKTITILLLLLVTGFFVNQAGQLKTNATPYFLDETHPSRQADSFVKNTFSNSGEVMMIATITEQADIFNMQSLSEIYDFTVAIENLTLTDETDIAKLNALKIDDFSSQLVEQAIADGFKPSDKNLVVMLKQHLTSGDTAINLNSKQLSYINDLETRLRPVRKVRNVVRIESITSENDELDIHPMMYNLPKNTQELADLKYEALNNPLLHNIVFSPKGNAVNNFIELNILQDDAPNMRRFYDSVKNMIADMELSDSYHMGGPPAIFAQTSSIIKQDSDKLFPAIFMVVMLVLYVLFRNLRSVFMPMMVAVLSVIWTLGTMSYFGYKQNLVSTIMPVFLISIGVADSIHYLTEYRRQRKDNDHTLSLKLALHHLWKPMLMTTITTMIGFLSLAYTELDFIKQFGLFVALGVFYAYIITVCLLPAVLGSLPSDKNREKESRLDKVINKLVSLNTDLILNQRKKLYVVAAILVIPLGYFIHNLQVDNVMIGYFDDESKIYQDNETIKQHFAGASSVEFTIQSTELDFFKSIAGIQLLERLEKTLIETPHVNAIYGLADFLKLINREVTDQSAAQYRIPYENEALIPQYYLLYESSNGDDITAVIDSRYQQSRMVAFLDSDQASKIEHIVAVANQQIADEGLDHISILESGFGNVLINTKQEVISSQVVSLALSFIGIFIVLSLLFKSPIVGLIGILPLTFTVFINFSFMSSMGLFLDVGTSIVAPIAIGVGVDYAIYFLSALKRHRKDFGSMDLAISQSLKELYRPIGFNTLVLGFGFLVLNLSSHQSLINLGMLISSTMLISAVITLTLLPAIVRSLDVFSKEADKITVETTNTGKA